MNQYKPFMLRWITENTCNHASVVEFGCMFGARFKFVHSSVKNRIGIEIFKPYLDDAVEEFTKIHGDMCSYNTLVDIKYHDCALFIDSIEHIEKEDGIALLKRVQKTFNKILLITPDGYFKFDCDLHGYGSHETQRHKCGWTKEDLEKLGFKVFIIDKFHPPSDINPRGCIFATWEKPLND